MKERKIIPRSLYFASALSCCLLNLAHFANSSCELVACISRFNRTTSALNELDSCTEPETGVGR